MDTPPPPALDFHTLITALRNAWSVEADELTYLPKGVGSSTWRAGSYFITIDDLDTKPWIGRGPRLDIHRAARHVRNGAAAP